MFSQTTIPQSINSYSLADFEFEIGVIPRDWLISGSPEIRFKILGRTKDLLAMAAVWECGVVSYRWRYHQDETYVVLSGEGFMTDVNGVERRYGPGDVAFFSAGTSAIWRHPSHFRKLAVLKESTGHVGAVLAGWKKLLRKAGLTGK